MNGPDHYKKAEDLLERSGGEELEWAQLLVAQAQVHATLAVAASNTATSREEFTAWREVTDARHTDVEALHAVNVETTRDFLLLVKGEIPLGRVPSHDEISSWSSTTRGLVADWAVAVHLVASDNDVEIPAIPDVLTPEGGEVA